MDSRFHGSDSRLEFFSIWPRNFRNFFVSQVSGIYYSVHNYIETGEKIPPTLPLPKGGIPLFEKEGSGEILKVHVRSIMDSLISAP
jgi:hypothetical protein